MESTSYFDFVFKAFDLEIAIEIKQVHTRFIKLPITLSFWHNVDVL